MAAYKSDGQPRINRKLTGYAKSVEEEMLKSCLKLFLSQERKLVNLIIEGCNSKRACSFPDAFVELEAYQQSRCDEPTPDRRGVFITDIIDKDILNQFVLSGVESVPHVEPFLVMLDFIHDRRKHEKAISKILKNTGETSVMVALTEHLFSQLLASKDYSVDCLCRDLPKKCPCGCHADIKSGTTTLGSCFTWHGRVSVLLNQTVPVQIFSDQEVIASADDSLWNTEDLSEADSEPRRKRKKGKDTLYDLRVLDEIVAEAVTNGFTLVNKKTLVSDLLIPTIGTTSEYFTILLYDPVNDILLQDTLRFSIWEYRKDDKLNMFSVVCLWLFLNFTSFELKTSKWREKIEAVESKFHHIMGRKIERYIELSTQNHPSFQTEILKDTESSYGEILDLTCQRIVKKIN